MTGEEFCIAGLHLIQESIQTALIRIRENRRILFFVILPQSFRIDHIPQRQRFLIGGQRLGRIESLSIQPESAEILKLPVGDRFIVYFYDPSVGILVASAGGKSRQKHHNKKYGCRFS